jgi:hypothetical protein
VLKYALTSLYNDKIENQYYSPVRTYILNPKSVTLGELYGEVNPFTLEWKDGLLGTMMKTAVKVGIKWIQVLYNICSVTFVCMFGILLYMPLIFNYVCRSQHFYTFNKQLIE